MNVYVCAKYVPDSTVTNTLSLQTKRLVRENVPQELDPAAASAVEEGLRLVELHGGSVSVATLGPPEAEEGVRKALAMGAETAIVISDPAFAGSDAWATAQALAAALKNEPFDLVLGATESTDTNTGLVPGMLAELLGIPQLTFARQVGYKDGQIVVHRQSEIGYEVVACSLPCLVTVASGINEPRYPSLRGVLAAKRKEIKRYTAADLGLSPEQVGEAGSREKVLAIEPAPARVPGRTIVDRGDAAGQIADLLEQLKVI